MTYYGPKDLADAFRTVRSNTIAIAEEIPEKSYTFMPAPGVRTVAQTLVHIAVMPRVPRQIHFTDHLSTLAGFDFFGIRDALTAEELQPRTKQQVIGLLRTEGEQFAQLLEGSSEDFLAEVVTYPPGMTPPSKTRFEMLLSPKEHEMHHRGQLMLVQRQLGLVPPLTRRMQEFIAQMKAQQSGAAAH